MTLRLMAVAISLVLVTSPDVRAQATPESENGRYTFSPTADGVLRLDTRTGALASCHNRISGWACYAVPDERAALDKEIGKLQQENTALKDTLAKFKDDQTRTDREIAALKEAHKRLDAERMALKDEIDKRLLAEGRKIDAPLAKEDALKKGVARDAGKSNRLELQLPDDREVERVVSFVERAWRQLIEMASRVQKDVAGKI